MAVPKAVGVYFTTCLCGLATEKRQATTSTYVLYVSYDSQLLSYVVVSYLAGFASQQKGKYSTGNNLLLMVYDSRRFVLLVYQADVPGIHDTRTECAHRHQGVQSVCVLGTICRRT